MPNPQIYTDELELFKVKYNLEDYDLYKVQESDKLRNLGNVLNNGNISGSTATQFVGWAKKL